MNQGRCRRYRRPLEPTPSPWHTALARTCRQRRRLGNGCVEGCDDWSEPGIVIVVPSVSSAEPASAEPCPSQWQRVSTRSALRVDFLYKTLEKLADYVVINKDTNMHNTWPHKDSKWCPSFVYLWDVRQPPPRAVIGYERAAPPSLTHTSAHTNKIEQADSVDFTSKYRCNTLSLLPRCMFRFFF